MHRSTPIIPYSFQEIFISQSSKLMHLTVKNTPTLEVFLVNIQCTLYPGDSFVGKKEKKNITKEVSTCRRTGDSTAITG